MAKDTVEKVGILFSVENDATTQKQADRAIKNFTDLISDLGMAGKVAGTVLNSLWSGVQNSISVGLREFEDYDLGVRLGIDPKELSELKYVMSQINVSDKDTMKMLDQLDKVIQSFRNPATGAVEIEKFYEKFATYNIPQEDMDRIANAIKAEDLTELVKQIASLSEDLGDEWSNFTVDWNIPQLASLEADYQREDFNKALERIEGLSNLTDVDIEGLNDLSDGIADFQKVLDALAREFGELLGSPIKNLGDAMLDATNAFLEWKKDVKLPKLVKEVGGLGMQDAKAFGTAYMDYTKSFGNLLAGKQGIPDFIKDIGSITKEFATSTVLADEINRELNAIKELNAIYETSKDTIGANVANSSTALEDSAVLQHLSNLVEIIKGNSENPNTGQGSINVETMIVNDVQDVSEFTEAVNAELQSASIWGAPQ